MPSTGPGPVISAARFVITVDDDDVTFTELVGISSAAGACPEESSPPTVTLRRGFDGRTQIWAWHQEVLAGKPGARKTCTIALQDDSGRTQMAYTLENACLSRLAHTVESAWRSRLDVAAMPASATQVVIETVTITCDSISMRTG